MGFIKSSRNAERPGTTYPPPPFYHGRSFATPLVLLFFFPLLFILSSSLCRRPFVLFNAERTWRATRRNDSLCFNFAGIGFYCARRAGRKTRTNEYVHVDATSLWNRKRRNRRPGRVTGNRGIKSIKYSPDSKKWRLVFRKVFFSPEILDWISFCRPLVYIEDWGTEYFRRFGGKLKCGTNSKRFKRRVRLKLIWQAFSVRGNRGLLCELNVEAVYENSSRFWIYFIAIIVRCKFLFRRGGRLSRYMCCTRYKIWNANGFTKFVGESSGSL